MVEEIYTLPGFETRFLERLKQMVAALPKGSAELSVTKKQAGSKVACPYFLIRPSNQRSAKVEGFFLEGDGINLTIGEATWVEIYISPKQNSESRGMEKFVRICQEVFTTHFTEKVIYSASGRVLYSRIILQVNCRKVRLGSYQLFWRIFPRKIEKQFSYDPYY